MKKIILLIALTFITTLSFALDVEPKGSDIANMFATASELPTKKYPWPFKVLSIGHAMQSYQDYSGSPYWHDGLDIRGDKNTEVIAPAGGVVVNIEHYNSGPNYWEVAVLDSEGFVWKFHHIDHDSITDEVNYSYKNHSPIPAGTVIGKIVTWPISSYGEVYHHLHLLIVDGQGRYVNPFHFFELLPDNKSPVIKNIGLVQNFEILDHKNSVKGAHGIYVEASDLVLHDKFILPPHEITYSLDGAEEKLFWRFDYIPSMTNDEDFINDFYLPETCGNYSCRKIFMNLLFSPSTPRAEWTLARGKHIITINVRDFNGLSDSKKFDWTVE